MNRFFKKSLEFVKRKKFIIIFMIILCLAVYAAGVWIANEYAYFVSGMWEWEVKDFSHNKSYFELVAKNLYPYFEEEYERNSQLQSIQILDEGDEWELIYFYNEATEKKTELVSMSDEEQKSVEKIRQALHHKYDGFSHIEVHKERVTFASVYYYAVVWSRNGDKPGFLLSPDEKGEFFSNRLSFFSDKWYQCILK